MQTHVLPAGACELSQLGPVQALQLVNQPVSLEINISCCMPMMTCLHVCLYGVCVCVCDYCSAYDTLQCASLGDGSIAAVAWCSSCGASRWYVSKCRDKKITILGPPT
eukprot:jgi/Ulvmu1/11202/UM072_0038.1